MASALSCFDKLSMRWIIAAASVALMLSLSKREGVAQAGQVS